MANCEKCKTSITDKTPGIKLEIPLAGSKIWTVPHLVCINCFRKS